MTFGGAGSGQDDVGREYLAEESAPPRAGILTQVWRSGRRRWIATAVAVPLLLCGLVLAVCGPPAALTRLLAKPSESPVAKAPVPPVKRSADVLVEQAHALLAGDEAGWLKDVTANDPPLRQRYRDIFVSLRGLGVTRFDPAPASAGPGQVQVSITYCLASGHCCQTDDACRVRLPVQPFEVPKTRWMVTFAFEAEAMRITGLQTPQRDQSKGWPAPWETGPLTIHSNSRVIVAAPPSLADLAALAFAQAQSAAPLIDSYTTVWRPPLRYIIYLADGEAFNNVWFGGKPPWETEIAGYAVSQIRHVQYEVVLKVPFEAEPTQLVRHEMAHVATLDSADTGRVIGLQQHSWFTEGIAEHAAYHGQPATADRRVQAAKSYVVNQWAGDLTQPAKAKDPTTNPPRNIKYALGHLAVTCLVNEYSFSSMLNFFSLLVRDDKGLDTAARASFGSSWQAVNDHCAAYIRKMLS